jgi:2'-5' RNA ligase
MIRTFVAVEISPAVRQRAGELVEKCRALGIDAKWVALENMHITLQFLGSIRENLVPLVCRAVFKAVERLPAFDVICHGVGAFPNPERPRIIWLGMTAGREELIQLQAAVEAALEDLGFRGEARRFEPHLTIGRLRSSAAGMNELAEFVAAHGDYDGAAFDVSEVLIVSSELDKYGPRYEILGRAELAG